MVTTVCELAATRKTVKEMIQPAILSELQILLLKAGGQVYRAVDEEFALNVESISFIHVLATPMYHHTLTVAPKVVHSITTIAVQLQHLSSLPRTHALTRLHY